jgi:thiol-disulfide isomerase/thioredoxin
MNSIWIVSMVLQWLVIALLCAVVVSLIRQLGAMTLKLNALKEKALDEGPQVLTRIGAAREVILANGGSVEVGGDQPRPALIVFFSPMCGSCEQLPGALRQLAKEADREFDLLAVVSLNRTATAGYAREQGLGKLAVASREDFPEDILPQGGVPMALGVTSDGTIAARGQPKNERHLREMGQAAAHMADVATTHSRRRHEWGESAPYWDAAQVRGT